MPVTLEKSALEYYGGFEKFQIGLYEDIRNHLLELPAKNLLDLEKRYNVSPNPKRQRLDVFDFIRNQQLISHDLAHFFSFTGSHYPQCSVELTPEDREYWQNEIVSAGSFIANIGARPSVELYIFLTALEESDKIAKEKLGIVN